MLLPHAPEPLLSSRGKTSFDQLTAQLLASPIIFPPPEPEPPELPPELDPPPSAGAVAVAVPVGADLPTRPSGGPNVVDGLPPQDEGDAPPATSAASIKT